MINRAERSAPTTLQKVRQPRAAEAANHVPTFDADVTGVLADARQRLNLLQFVVSRLLHRAAYSQAPVFKNHARIVHVIVVDGKLCQRSQVGILESRRQVPGAEQPRRHPVAESKTFSSNDSCKLGIAKAPSTSTGVSLSNSRRFIRRNFFSSIFGPCRSRNHSVSRHGIPETARSFGVTIPRAKEYHPSWCQIAPHPRHLWVGCLQRFQGILSGRESLETWVVTCWSKRL